MDSEGRILIIGDKRLNVEQISSYLCGAGYEVILADAGKVSIEITCSSMPDVIVVDITMPEQEGFEIVSTLKRHWETGGIPTILVTPRNSAGNKIKGLDCGPDEFLARPVGKPEILSSVRSFLELKRRREKIRETILKEEKDFAINLIQNISTPTFVLDANHNIIIWNKACEELTGFSACEMIGENRQWQPFYSCPRPTLADALIDGDTETVSELYPDSAISCINPMGLQSEGWSTTRAGRKLCLSFDAEPVYDSDGKLVAVIESFRDITEIKRFEEKFEEAVSELESMRTKIVVQEKTACIGRIAAGIAHEINNPISHISSNLHTVMKYAESLENIIRRQPELPEETRKPEASESLRAMKTGITADLLLPDIRELIRESIDGADRIKTMVGNLENFSRGDNSEYVDADVNECVASAIDMVWGEIKHKVTMIRNPGRIPRTRCNPPQLTRVFLNLLVNAAQAIENQGEVTVRTWHKRGSIYVSVTDTGCGIPPSIHGKIFEPFFTTKEVDNGAGLGLSIAYDIVRKHDGEILVESETGRGTTVTVRLPVIYGNRRG